VVEIDQYIGLVDIIGRYLGFADILVPATTANCRHWQNAVIFLTQPDNLLKKA